MSIFSSLTNRIFVASALLAIFSIAVGIYNVNVAVTSQAERDLLRGLDEARTLIDENRRILVEHFTREARLIADAPRLKAAVELDDAPTVQPIVEEFQQQLAADLFVVTNRNGRILARLPLQSPFGGELTGVQRAVTGREAATFVAHADGILQIVSVPIWIDPVDPEIFGTLSIGFSLDRHAADRFRALTNSDIAFGMGDAIKASTLAPAGWATLAPLLRHDGLTRRLWLGGSEYIAMTVELSSDGTAATGVQRVALDSPPDTAKAIILRSRTEQLSFLTPLHTSLLLTALVVVLAATVVSYGIARTVTRPLGAITATMRDMAATGDLTRKIPLPANPRWEDEDARLLATTFNAMTGSIVRFQREAAQRERHSALGRLSTVVAHEIRNPLMIIKSALRGLRRADVTPADVSAAVADIDEEIVRLNRIVTEVLDFAKPIKFELAPTDVNAVCADALRATSQGAPPIKTRLALQPGMPTTVSDGERLRLVLVNLLTNSRQAIAAREGAPQAGDMVIVTTTHAGDQVRIDVRDRGVGIAPEDLPSIFDPYFTTRRTGTGLGLAICRSIVEGLGGRITVESRLGEGTSVRIVLPIR